ncbi:hypothetical protein QBC34DRAFT_59044 [Podospora aff. communis PSN243]|uniref:Uncharacterized protein n=1 Tax=Podospora aff. communis PSN243 TaxID=3040156 RepID=A0AAV9GXC7_9PEZI|nr:hypothetical protein QBC34DRAFT_59044 [Podospora aff. communis PSN243]
MANKAPSLPEVAEAVFGRQPRSSGELKPYYKHFQGQWAEFTARHSAGPIPTFADFTSVTHKVSTGVSRERIIIDLEEKHQEKGYPPETLQGLVDLAARALTMVQIDLGGSGCLAWTTGSLQEFLSTTFPEEPTLEYETIKLHNSFDAWAVENLGGIVVVFTDNLADHLRLVRNGGAVLIFHHVSLLQFLDGQASSENSPLPPPLIKETLQTLSLLFPKTEFSSFLGMPSGKAKWLKASIRTWEDSPSSGGAKVDSGLFRCASLPMYGRRVESYRYWRDRLVLLKQRCDEGTLAGKASKEGMGFAAMAALNVGHSTAT